MQARIVALVLLGVVAGPAASPMLAMGERPPAPAASSPTGASLQTFRTCQYRMAGKIRPLLFWIGRDNVGLARIAWRRGEGDARGYELLVGTDPRRAPRAINRWGYIAEECSRLDGGVLAVMSRSDEVSLADARTNVERGASAGDFKAMRAHVAGGVATAQVASVRTEAPLTIYEVTALLDEVRAQTALAARREASAPADARSGFLVAVAELVDGTLDRLDSPTRPLRALEGARVGYVFGLKHYELRIASLRTAEAERDDLPLPDPLVRAGFEIRNPSTDERTRFELVYPTRGELAGVPVMIAWQPRWWLRVELHLEDTAR